MAFTMTCPACNRMLNVTEKAFGKTVPCPGCKQPIWVPSPQAEPAASQWTRPPAIPPNAVHAGGATQPAEAILLPGIPPTPPDRGAFDAFGDRASNRSTGEAFSRAVEDLNLADKFLGNEKEQLFTLLPGEERLDEVTIHHQYFYMVKSGMTRVTLTTQRLLYTTTRVFSPVYWLLVVLMPPLLFYYAVRVGRNGSVGMPLGSVDSVAKRYRANWSLFILAAVAGLLLIRLLEMAIHAALGGGHHEGDFAWGTEPPGAIEYVLSGIWAALCLILLLTTRMVSFVVHSRGGIALQIAFKHGDAAPSEEEFDRFFQKTHAQSERARAGKT